MRAVAPGSGNTPARGARRRLRQGRWGGRRGVAAVEFAFTFPLMAVLMLLTVEFGFYFSRLQLMAQLTREAVRYASNQDSLTKAQVFAAASTRQLLDDVGMPCGADCTVAVQVFRTGGLDHVAVDLRYPYRQLTGILPTNSILPIPVPRYFNARAVMPLVGPRIDGGP
jgi:hypothetical protein